MTDTPPAPDPIAELDKLFAPWNRTDAPGLTVGVIKDGAVVYRRGFGMASLETGVALTPRTGMRIGSMTKHFTALMALLHAEEGRLDLDAPIRAYLPELTGPGGDPSLRELLRHRGGSRCYLDLGFIGHGMSTPPKGRALAMQVRQTGRNFPVGEAMIYNNGGYHLVSIAIERVGGAPLAQQLRARLFDPLAMADTALVLSDHVITPGMATLHLPLPRGGWRRGLFPSEEVSGEGGIVSTVDDMLRWMRHLRSRDKFGAPESWAELTDLPVYADGSTGAYALGLIRGDYRGAPVVHHAGGVIGGVSQMLTFPEHGLDIVILVNGALGADPVALAESVADIVLAERLGERIKPIPAADHAGLLGEWWSPETGMVYGLLDHNGDLKLSLCGAAVGAPLTLDDGGQAIAAMGSIGDIAVDLATADPEGGLAITFAGARRLHLKANPDDVHRSALAGLAQGRYVSVDGDCEVEIASGAKDIKIVFHDPYGTEEWRLAALSDVAAIASRGRSAAGPLLTVAVLFERQDGETIGFRANTSRTRNLAFKKLAEAPA